MGGPSLFLAKRFRWGHTGDTNARRASALPLQEPLPGPPETQYGTTPAAIRPSSRSRRMIIRDCRLFMIEHVVRRADSRRCRAERILPNQLSPRRRHTAPSRPAARRSQYTGFPFA